MAISGGTFLHFGSAVDVSLDGPTIVDPGSASVVRIVTATGSMPAVHAVKGGVDGRWLRLINVATSPATAVDLVRDQNATVGASTDRLRCPSATCDLFTYGVVTMVYGAGAWRLVRTST